VVLLGEVLEGVVVEPLLEGVVLLPELLPLPQLPEVPEVLLLPVPLLPVPLLLEPVALGLVESVVPVVPVLVPMLPGVLLVLLPVPMLPLLLPVPMLPLLLPVWPPLLPAAPAPAVCAAAKARVPSERVAIIRSFRIVNCLRGPLVAAGWWLVCEVA
jgi:hypothetical protein